MLGIYHRFINKHRSKQGDDDHDFIDDEDNDEVDDGENEYDDFKEEEEDE